jgi:hypothetical protein
MINGEIPAHAVIVPSNPPVTVTPRSGFFTFILA